MTYIRSFSYAAPFLWNHLLNTIRYALTYISFKKNLKTYLIKPFLLTLLPLYQLTLLVCNCYLLSGYILFDKLALNHGLQRKLATYANKNTINIIIIF